MAIVGLINPGAMGASVGAAAIAGGNKVLWASSGRSEATIERAKRAGLEDCITLDALVDRVEVILSVCPPHSADQVANAIAGKGFDGLYLEGNAISPDRTRGIGRRITEAGATFVDGGIIGGPAWSADSNTTLHLSGTAANQVADLFNGSNLKTNIVSGEIGAASALKMVYAAFTKGSAALLLAILGVAEQEGVRDQLETQWGEAATEQNHARALASTPKAWRFAGEMEEIAATFAGAGVPDGFHLAAAEVFNRIATFKDKTPTPPLQEILTQLLKSGTVTD